MSASYREHTRIYLCNKFAYMSKNFVEDVMEKHNHHLTASYKDLRKLFRAASSVPNYYQQNKSRPEQPLPTEHDEHFYSECMFVKHETEIIGMYTLIGKHFFLI